MALNRGTRKEIFAHNFQRFAILGIIAGAGFGIFQMLGEDKVDMVIHALQMGFFGFIGGSLVGIVIGAIAAVFAGSSGER